MSPTVRVDPASNSALYIVGEELVCDVRWVDAGGVVQPIDETAAFVGTIFVVGGATIASSTAEMLGPPTAPFLRFAWPLTIAEDLAGRRGVYVSLARVTNPGPPVRAVTFFTFSLPVRQLADAIAPVGLLSPSVDAPTLIEISPGGVTISPRGPAGASAAQQLAAARDPDTGHPYTDAPTVAAMAVWLRDQAREAATDVTEEAQEAIAAVGVAIGQAQTSISAANSATAAALAAARKTSGVDLTDPQIPGLLPLRLDGLDPDGTNSARITQTFAYCAANGLPVYVPHGAIIGVGKLGLVGGEIQLPDGLDFTGRPGHEFRRLWPNEAERLFDTASLDVPIRVRIDGLRWRGMAGAIGGFFRGVFRDSILSGLTHLGNVERGQSMVLGLYRSKVLYPVIRDMQAAGGNAGIRIIEGEDSDVILPDVESGDDALQFVPSPASGGKRMVRVNYRGGRGVSSFARGGIMSNDVFADAVIQDCGFRDGVYLKGAGWPLWINSRSHYSWGVVGARAGGAADLAFAALSIRGQRPIQPGEQVTLTSALDPSWNVEGPILSAGSATARGRFQFSSVARTITALDGATPFGGFVPGSYVIVFDGVGVNGVNDNLLARIVDSNPAQLLLDRAPVDEISDLYAVSNNANFTLAVAGTDGPAPADLEVRRRNPGRIDGAVVDAVLDDDGGVRAMASLVSGWVRNLRARLVIRNLRGTALKVADGYPDASNNVIAIEAGAPVNAVPIVDVPYSQGLTLAVDLVAAPGFPAVLIRKKIEFDEDYPEVILNKFICADITVGGTVRVISAGQVAVRAGPEVTRVNAVGLAAIAATGVTTAGLITYAETASGIVSRCNLAGLPGTTAEAAIAINPTATVLIAGDNQSVPGLSAQPGVLARGVATEGQATIALAGAVPASFVGRVELLRNGVSQMPGDDFTTNGTVTLTLAAPMAAGETYRATYRS